MAHTKQRDLEPGELSPAAIRLFEEQIAEIRRRATGPTVVLRSPYGVAVLPDEVEDLNEWVMNTLDGWGVMASVPDIKATARKLKRARTKVREGGGSPAPKGKRGSSMASAPRVEVLDYDTSKSRPPEWVWDERYVAGYLNLICGEEKVGKGVLAAWTIARLTRGELDGCYLGTPVTVGVIADEDGWADVWVPRLHAAGVDGTRVKKLAPVGSDMIEVQTHAADIARVVEEHGIKLLYIDALDDLLGAADDWRSKQVRAALKPLRWLAGDLGVAVVGSKHPNLRGNSFRELMSGTAAFGAVARSSMLLAKHPTGESNERVLTLGSGNLADPDSLEFRIVSARFELNGYDWDVPVAEDFVVSDLTTGAILEAAQEPKKQRAVSDKRQALQQRLRDGLVPDEWTLSAPIRVVLEEEGFSRGMIDRAAQDVGVEQKAEGFPLKSYWRLC